MEVPVEGDFTGKVDFKGWRETDKYDLIKTIIEGGNCDIDVYISSTIEVEPPERDDRE